MAGTAKAFLRINRAKTGGTLNVRYTYDSDWFPVPLGVSLTFDQFDNSAEQVKKNFAGYADLNKQIRQIKSDLLEISEFLENEGIEPKIQIVKEEYQKRLNEKSAAAQRAKVKESAQRGLKAIYGYEMDEIAVQEGILTKSKQLLKDEIEKFGIELNTTATEDAQIFRSLLYQYIKVKTGQDIYATTAEIKNDPNNTSTKNQLRSWAKTFLKFTKAKYLQEAGLTLSLKDLDEQFYNAYWDYLTYSGGNNLYDNTFGQHVKKLKSFLKWVEVQKRLKIDKRYTLWKVTSEKKEIITLSPEEIDLLWNMPEDYRYRTYVDIAVFGCLTSLRISDIKKAEGLIEERGLIRSKTQKTNSDFKIPLNIDPRISQILKKYNYQLCLFSEQAFNERIKLILEELFTAKKINQKEITINRFKRGRKYPSKFKKHELFTSHCLRRSYVVNMYERGFTESFIMETMGTKSYKEFRKYLEISGKHIVSHVERMNAQSSLI